LSVKKWVFEKLVDVNNSRNVNCFKFQRAKRPLSSGFFVI